MAYCKTESTFSPTFAPVYTSFQLAQKYIRYYLTACNGKGHGVHSPFVFDFIVCVLNNKKGYHPPNNIEHLRKRLLKDATEIEMEDLGAGSRKGTTKKRTVRQIAATAVKPKKWSYFLFRLAAYYRPKTIIELGTSLGVSTAYMAAANKDATLHTIEGSGAVQQLATRNFNQLSCSKIQSYKGNFDDVLPLLLTNIDHVDLAYIDGNHRYAPTMAYFEQLLLKKSSDSIFIFDDIHWSAEMEQAWAKIKGHPSVTISIDLFFMGLIFFRPEIKVSQHFTIRF